MQPPKSWTPSSDQPDPGLGTRDAPHGYRPWPNSGRAEPASVHRFRRPSILDSLLEKIRTHRAVVAFGDAGIAKADAIVIRSLTPRTSRAVARHLKRGQLLFLESSTASTRKELLTRLRKTGKEFLLAWSTPRGLAGLDDNSRRAAAALVDARDPS